MILAVVIPIFNEQDNLPEVRRRVAAACDSIAGLRWRIIYVNDGSKDNSLALMLAQHAEDPRVEVIELSRNFGHQPAISAGLRHAEESVHADAVIVMDGDLQDPPEVIPELVAAWQAGGQVIGAQRRSRQERGLRRLGFDLFHFMFGWLSDFPIARDVGVFGLMDSAALHEFNALRESHRFIPGLRSWVGFDQRVVFYDRQDRSAGAPKQSLTRLIRYALDGVFSFSYKPLRMMTYFGMLVSFVGFCLAAFYIVNRLLGSAEKSGLGFTTLVTLILFLGGLQLIALGLMGEYVGRIYDEVKGRPLYIVRRKHVADESATRPATPG
jgi:glycosyltransferase involved in cell wall biosynthesis